MWLRNISIILSFHEINCLLKKDFRLIDSQVTVLYKETPCITLLSFSCLHIKHARIWERADGEMQELSAKTEEIAAGLQSTHHRKMTIHKARRKRWETTAVCHHLKLQYMAFCGIQKWSFKRDQIHFKKLPFSASGARTSKTISFFSCSDCFWKRRTSSSAILVDANCSLLDSEGKAIN